MPNKKNTSSIAAAYSLGAINECNSVVAQSDL